ncbi:MAG: VCBS repeat-containing protein [Nitrospirae bacterium]|nr:VCBS repeat-containing protein [Nitrospirota bacterium]
MRHNKLLIALLMTVVIYATASTAGADSTGSTLFLSYCISCHNTVPSTDPTLIGATATKITNAMTNISQMQANATIQTLTSAQIQSIADYIVGKGQSSNWTIVGVGDFNGDGNTDILWRDTINGTNYVWLMNGTSYSSGLALPSLTGNTWIVSGVGDFDKDGKADILWRNISTGENVIWLMNGAAIKGYASLPTLSDRDWVVAAVADFNGDGNKDILWRHMVGGYNVLWYLNGTTYSSYAVLTQLSDVSWVVGGATDMDNDGSTDVVWRNKTSGYNAYWDLYGATLINSYLMSPQVTDQNWSIVGVAKTASNGYVNVYWRNQISGSNAILTMNGASVVNSAVLPTIAP